MERFELKKLSLPVAALFSLCLQSCLQSTLFAIPASNELTTGCNHEFLNSNTEKGFGIKMKTQEKIDLEVQCSQVAKELRELEGEIAYLSSRIQLCRTRGDCSPELESEYRVLQFRLTTLTNAKKTLYDKVAAKYNKLR